MKIVVCMKQVPATSKVDIDPETGAMKRMSGETRTNPYDLFALETALAIREKTGGTVTVLTMGPPQAEEMIRTLKGLAEKETVRVSDKDAFLAALANENVGTIEVEGVITIGVYGTGIFGICLLYTSPSPRD